MRGKAIQTRNRNEKTLMHQKKVHLAKVDSGKGRYMRYNTREGDRCWAIAL